MHKRSIALLLTSLSIVSLAAGCGGSNSTSPGTATTTAGAQPSPASTGPALHTIDSKYGKIIADPQGRVLYLFDKDTPPKSNCSGQCAVKWPPVEYPSDLQVSGIDKLLVSSMTRDDGTKQLTVAGWPMYRYEPDTNPGDVKGQAVGGVWWVVGPDGRKITTSAGA